MSGVAAKSPYGSRHSMAGSGRIPDIQLVDRARCSLTAGCRVCSEAVIPKRPDAPIDPSPQVGPAWPGSGPWTPPNDLHSAPECHTLRRSRLGHAVVPWCPPRVAGIHSISNIFIYHSHKAESRCP